VAAGAAARFKEEKLMHHRRLVTAFVMAAAVGFAAAPGAEAQELPAPAQPAVEVTPELLERFVEVYPDIMVIAQSAQNELATAETEESAQAIQAEAREQIAATLEAAEFTVVEYEAIVARLNEDEALRAEFERLLREELERRSG
jgi:hypothetical protein